MVVSLFAIIGDAIIIATGAVALSVIGGVIAQTIKEKKRNG